MLEQMKANYWVLTHRNELRLSKGERALLAIIHRCEELPEYKEVSFKLINQSPLLPKEDPYILPGFLLSPTKKEINLEDEIKRTCDYVLHKHLIPVDDTTKKIDTGRYTYKIEKIIINSVENNRAELIVEVAKRKNNIIRNGCVDFFINETIPILTGDYKNPRLKALTEFIRAFIETNYLSFIIKTKKTKNDLHCQKAVKALNTLINHLLNSYEPKTFKIYPKEIIEDRTGQFNNIEFIELYDLERELFNTKTRYEIKNIYEANIEGKHYEIKEFKKKKLLSEMNLKDRKFYQNYIDQIRDDFFKGKPLKLRITSKIKNQN